MLSMCCSEPFCFRFVENINTYPENSSIGDQNLNILNPSKKKHICFAEIKTLRFKSRKNLIEGE